MVNLQFYTCNFLYSSCGLTLLIWVLLTAPSLVWSHWHWQNGHERKKDTPQWDFGSTVWESEGAESGSRSAKLSDDCYFPAWQKHAKPILKAMAKYNKVKKNFTGWFKKAKDNKETKANSPHEFVYEVAKELWDARKKASDELEKQFISGDLEKPLDIRGSGESTSKLLQLVCEGGELLYCAEIGETQKGHCRCFNLDEGKPLYATSEVDGHCMGELDSTCNPEDPVFPNKCNDKLECHDYTYEECQFAFNKKFHCDGYPKGKIRFQNLYCSRYGHHPRSFNDLGSKSPDSFKYGVYQCITTGLLLTMRFYPFGAMALHGT